MTAEKDKLASAPANVNVRVNAAQETNLVLGVGQRRRRPKEALAKTAELKKVFDEGVALSSAGNHDEAIAKFTAAAALSPTCFDCYNNIGFSYTPEEGLGQGGGGLQEVDRDEGRRRRGLQRPGNVYNAQRKFDLAAEASAKATELAGVIGAAGGSAGNADALYNQGVILFNGGKAAEAKQLFESAIAGQPESCRSALHARHGAGRRADPAESGHRSSRPT